MVPLPSMKMCVLTEKLNVRLVLLLSRWPMLRMATRNVCRRRLRCDTSWWTEVQSFRLANARGIQVILVLCGVMFRFRPAGAGVGVGPPAGLGAVFLLDVSVDGAGCLIRNNATRFGRRELTVMFLVWVRDRTACTSPGMPMLPGTPV